jgi:hypothetical protein
VMRPAAPQPSVRRRGRIGCARSRRGAPGKRVTVLSMPLRGWRLAL